MENKNFEQTAMNLMPGGETLSDNGGVDNPTTGGGDGGGQTGDGGG